MVIWWEERSMVFPLAFSEWVMPAVKKYDNISEPIEQMISVIRGNLMNSDRLTVSLEEELNMVKGFVNLRRNINPMTPEVKWYIEKKDLKNIMIPSMLIQIPLENSIKYAFPDNVKPTDYISVSIRETCDNECVSISIMDNGCGYKPYSVLNKNGTGNGLKILYKTIILLNKNNTNKIIFDITSNENTTTGTTVNCIIPKKYKYDF